MATAVKDRPVAAISTDKRGEPQGDGNLGLGENCLRVLRARYLKKNEAGEVIETPAEMFRRVARTMADPEAQYGDGSGVAEWENRFYDLMVSGRFMPNSPTLMNAGREMGMLSACFVLPVRDSINEIFDSIKHTALIQKAGGGTGFAFDELRPTGDFIRSSGGTTSGPISFWRAFSEATNAIQQGAFRRGANMGMMYVNHPDILKFLHAKEDLSQFTNYNISVKVTDEWMERFLADPNGPHIVRNPRSGREYVIPKDLSIWDYDIRSLIPVRRGQGGELRVAEVDEAETQNENDAVARSSSLPECYTSQDIWEILVRNAHRTGEPGVVFIDRINEHNPTPHVGRIEATNPCGEQPLLPYEACNLGSINLGCFINDPCTKNASVDWDGLRAAVHESVRFLDNVIDANNYPLPEIEAVCKANRKIGLGVMGFADALYKLGIRYSSDEGVEWGDRFMQFLNDEAHNYSEQLANERGCFPNWAGSIWDTLHHRPMRNSATTTVAPTGTISIIAGCSGGIEPLFSLAFYRNVLKGQDKTGTPMIEVNPIFESVAKERGFLSEGLMDQVATDGTLAGIDGIPDDVKHVYVCAHDITPEWHVKMQAAFQRHCDASISKTINFPHEATKEDVDRIYRMAFELDCKGITVYRDRCREEQPMALKQEQAKEESKTVDQPAEAAAEAAPADTAPADTAPADVAVPAEVAPMAQTPSEDELKKEIRMHSIGVGDIEPRDIPEIVSGLRLRQMTPFGNMHVKITVDPKTGRELEVFAQLGKGGDLANSDLEAICRLTSLWLRAGGSLKHIIRQMKDIGSSLQVPTKEGKIKSLGDGLAHALQKYAKAKDRFGLRGLLLGEYDLNDMDKPRSAKSTNGNGHKPVNGKTNGNGHNGNGTHGNGRTNGHGNGNGNGHNKRHEPLSEVRHGKAAHDTHEAPATTRVAGASTDTAQVDFKVKCPSCGESLVFSEGCNKCYNCGWAQC
jgi:ribonucleoside-diphosphate reductase alpha chain